jgi:hypothetical protein
LWTSWYVAKLSSAVVICTEICITRCW